jgi:hypothetical protein
MMPRLRRCAFGLFATLAIFGLSGPASAADSFEVTSIKAIRPTIVAAIAALQTKDVAKSKAAMADFDSAWNGIETYINVRSKETYNLLELELEGGIDKGLDAPMPDWAKLTTMGQTLLAKFDDAVKMVEAGKPLNPAYDDVARLRMERAHLREVLPALKAGNLAKARKSYEAFDAGWDPIEDLIKAKSQDAYVAIEKAMIEIEQALMPDKPDVAKVTALINGLTMQYNAALAEVVKDARK